MNDIQYDIIPADNSDRTDIVLYEPNNIVNLKFFQRDYPSLPIKDLIAVKLI